MNREIKKENSKITQLPYILNKLLCNGGYYFDGQLSKIVEDNSSALVFKSACVVDKTIPLLIVSRQFYTEQAKTYPLSNKKEVNKLLKLELSDNIKSAYHIWQTDEEKTPVNIWTFSGEVPNAFMTIPESFLIALAHNQPQISMVERESSLFVGRLNNLIHSATANAVINTPERFANSTGVQSGDQTKLISSDNFITTLTSGFKRQTFSWLFSFINVKTTVDYKLLFKKIALPFTGVFASYLLLTSGYLLVANMLLTQELANQKTDVNQALNQQQQYDANIIRYTKLDGFLTIQKNSANFWLILPELFSQADFSNIRLENNRFILRGSTKQATELLVAISKIENVSDGRFDYPTRNSRGKDSFVISFVINSPDLDTPMTTIQEVNSDRN